MLSAVVLRRCITLPMYKVYNDFHAAVPIKKPLQKYCVHKWNTVTSICNYSSAKYDTSQLKGSISPEEVKEEKFSKFYFFPYISQVRFLSRLKLYQTGVTIAFVPLSTFLYSINIATLWNVQAGLAIATFACGMLYVMSAMFQRVVGMLSFNDREDIVRLSYLTFFGKRRELYLPVENIVPLSELPDNPGDVYVKVKWEGAKDTFYLSIKYGTIIDLIKFRKVFGVKSV